MTDVLDTMEADMKQIFEKGEAIIKIDYNKLVAILRAHSLWGDHPVANDIKKLANSGETPAPESHLQAQVGADTTAGTGAASFASDGEVSNSPEVLNGISPLASSPTLTADNILTDGVN